MPTPSVPADPILSRIDWPDNAPRKRDNDRHDFMVARDDEADSGGRSRRLSYEFATCHGQDNCGRNQSVWDTGDDVDYKPVVKRVFILLPMIPCTLLALRSPARTRTYETMPFPQSSAMLD